MGREKTLIAVIIMLSLVAAGLGFYLCQQYTDLAVLRSKYYPLMDDFAILQEEHETLEAERFALELEYGTLKSNYSQLSATFEELSLSHEILEKDYAFLEVELAEKDFALLRLEAQMENFRQMAEESVFKFYYASLSQQRMGLEDLAEYLARWEWSEGTYTKDVFDCSEMSAYIEWKLENEGYNTYIVCGDTPWGEGGHCWLLVEIDAGYYIPVEATTYDLVGWSNPYFDHYFEYDYIFEAIQDALEHDSSEFDWWNVEIQSALS